MLKILFFITGLMAFTGIYDYKITSTDGKEIPLSDFRGKMILLVNTASGSKYADQYESLEKLHQLYKDSLVIIAFPSNSFGKETADNAGIKNFVKNKYKVTYILAQKIAVKGEGQEPLYNWLTQQSNTKNMLKEYIPNDFCKFLIDTSGALVGAFDGSVDPMSEEMLSAIRSR
jgi:glutathione peroxidase